MIHRIAAVIALAVVAGALVGTASSASQATKAQAVAAGWDCSPNITILGYFHCAAPGKPPLLDLVTGAANPPTLSLNVYDGTSELFAGTELLIRADLFNGQNRKCTQEGGDWAFLDLAGADYYACHHFAA